MDYVLFGGKRTPPPDILKKIKKWEWFVSYFWSISDIIEIKNIHTGLLYRKMKLRFNQDGIFGYFSRIPELQFLIDFLHIEFEKILNPEVKNGG